MTTASVPEPDAEMLTRLAAMDLSAAEHVHAQLLAATEAETVASLSRAYARASRTLRQTLALKAKLARDAAEAERRTAQLSTPGRLDFDPEDARIVDLQEALASIAKVAIPDRAPREALLDRLDMELDDWREAPDFTTADLDAQVLSACRLLGLPEELGLRWRELPVRDLGVDWDDDPSEDDPADDDPADEDGARLAQPSADTG